MQNPDASVIPGGDFNELNAAEVKVRTSLHSIHTKFLTLQKFKKSY